MSLVGRVTNVTRDGALLLRSDRAVRIGASIVDSRRKPVGRVKDVIGPVAKPYVVVQPKGGAKGLLGKELYSQ